MKKFILFLLLSFACVVAQAESNGTYKKQPSAVITATGVSNHFQKYSFAPPENFTVNVKSSLATWNAPSDTSATPLQYQINLGNTPVATVPCNQFSYQFECLQYGQNYSASILAIYTSGISNPVSYSWTSTYLRPVADPFVICDFGFDHVNFMLQPIAPCDTTTPADWGLLSYTVFRDGDSLYNIPYVGSGTTYFEGATVDPGQHIYCAKTVWDLTSYGFPGQTDASMSVCDTVNVAYGYLVPFDENWSMGTFEYHQWSHEAHWVISNNQGNDPPSAQFQGTGATGYSEALTSYYVNMDTHSLGVVHLRYDIKLQNSNPTGTEKLMVQVNDGTEWHNLKTYSNNESFDWTTDSVYLTQYAINNVFSIRFLATGENSGNITAWDIDNISIIKFYDPPIYGFGIADWDDFSSIITWQAPAAAIFPQWLRYDNGTSDEGAILPDSSTFSVAKSYIRNNVDTIPCAYLGTAVKEIKFWLTDSSFQYVIAKIWKANYPNPPILCWSDTVNDFAVNQWTVVNVNATIINGSYIGYTIVGNQSGHYPVGVDTSTSYSNRDYFIDKSGNMTHLGNYTSYKLKIRPKVEGGDFMEATRPDYYLIYYYNHNTNDYNVLDTILSDTNLVFYKYSNPYPHDVSQDYYKIKAHWIKNNTSYLSGFGHYACQLNVYPDYIWVDWEGVEEHKNAGTLVLYPNPATTEITLQTENKMQQVCLFNYLGQIVYERTIANRKQTTVSTVGIKPGIYIVEVKTENGTAIKKLIVK